MDFEKEIKKWQKVNSSETKAQLFEAVDYICADEPNGFSRSDWFAILMPINSRGVSMLRFPGERKLTWLHVDMVCVSKYYT